MFMFVENVTNVVFVCNQLCVTCVVCVCVDLFMCRLQLIRLGLILKDFLKNWLNRIVKSGTINGVLLPNTYLWYRIS